MADIRTFFPLRKLVKARLELVGLEKNAKIGSFYPFYINPESWMESKSANWVKHSIPGLSDPIMQWTSSGARTITFDALVSLDIAEIERSDRSDMAAASSTTGGASIVQKLGSIAKQIFNVPDISFDSLSVDSAKKDVLNIDITSKLNFYRSLTYPVIINGKEGSQTYAPRAVRLKVGTTFGKRTSRSQFIVEKIDIKVVKQNPDLQPIEAIVSFSLVELVGKNLSALSDILSDK